jgi:hypothetical protein
LKRYRVLPFRADAGEGQPGHPLFIPTPSGAGRVDAPGTYSVVYVSSAPAGAVAEAFGGIPLWTSAMLDRPSLERSRRALAAYELPAEAPVLDLDDPDELKRLGLCPSDVVTRDRDVTQRWAVAVYREHQWIGVRWWSYYDPRWYSYGLWDRRDLSVIGVEALSLEHPAVVEAATVLRRPMRPT